MTKKLTDDILAIVARATPIISTALSVVNEWEKYFERMQIPEEKQDEEFNGIMKARVFSGIISVRAPQLQVTGEGCHGAT